MHPDFRQLWKLDRDPYLLETCSPGVFAAGDVRRGAMHRVASAVGEGSMAKARWRSRSCTATWPKTKSAPRCSAVLQPKPPCAHLAAVAELKTATVAECAECVKTGSGWVYLRTCQTCGVPLCCDSSPNRHATAHFLATQHPVVASAEFGESWRWCYEHE